ncbi:MULTISPECIES: hypothetical protein [unclassified Microcoleus]|uniref:hypothetical protein n=1 Tax=unclassified Microcoleus TaxID=2642155 RepID=UPI002FD1B652
MLLSQFKCETAYSLLITHYLVKIALLQLDRVYFLNRDRDRSFENFWRSCNETANSTRHPQALLKTPDRY